MENRADERALVGVNGLPLLLALHTAIMMNKERRKDRFPSTDTDIPAKCRKIRRSTPAGEHAAGTGDLSFVLERQ